MPKNLKVCAQSVCCKLQNEVQLKSFKIQKVQGLTLSQNGVNKKRVKVLKHLHVRSEHEKFCLFGCIFFTVQK